MRHVCRLSKQAGVMFGDHIWSCLEMENGELWISLASKNVLNSPQRRWDCVRESSNARGVNCEVCWTRWDQTITIHSHLFLTVSMGDQTITIHSHLLLTVSMGYQTITIHSHLFFTVSMGDQTITIHSHLFLTVSMGYQTITIHSHLFLTVSMGHQTITIHIPFPKSSWNYSNIFQFCIFLFRRLHTMVAVAQPFRSDACLLYLAPPHCS